MAAAATANIAKAGRRPAAAPVGEVVDGGSAAGEGDTSELGLGDTAESGAGAAAAGVGAGVAAALGAGAGAATLGAGAGALGAGTGPRWAAAWPPAAAPLRGTTPGPAPWRPRPGARARRGRRGEKRPLFEMSLLVGSLASLLACLWLRGVSVSFCV